VRISIKRKYPSIWWATWRRKHGDRCIGTCSYQPAAASSRHGDRCLGVTDLLCARVRVLRLVGHEGHKGIIGTRKRKSGGRFPARAYHRGEPRHPGDHIWSRRRASHRRTERSIAELFLSNLLHRQINHPMIGRTRNGRHSTDDNCMPLYPPLAYRSPWQAERQKRVDDLVLDAAVAAHTVAAAIGRMDHHPPTRRYGAFPEASTTKGKAYSAVIGFNQFLPFICDARRGAWRLVATLARSPDRDRPPRQTGKRHCREVRAMKRSTDAAGRACPRCMCHSSIRGARRGHVR